MAHQVKFTYLTQSEYDNISDKAQATLYFTSDTNRVYRGSSLQSTDAKKLYDDLLKQYINGECELYRYQCKRSMIDVLVDQNGYIFVPDNPSDEESVWTCVNPPSDTTWKLDVIIDYWHEWYPTGMVVFYGNNFTQDSEGKWHAQGYCPDIDEYVLSEQSCDTLDECYEKTYWRFQGDTYSGEAYYEYWEDRNVYFWQNDQIMAQDYFYNLGELSIYNHNFSWSQGRYGAEEPGTEDWRKIDDIALKSEVQMVKNLIPKNTSQLTNDSGFVTSSHSHSEYQISGLSAKLTGIAQTSISKTTGTITTLNSTTVNATTVNASSAVKVNGKDVSVSGHKHTKSEITDFSHNHTKSEITDLGNVSVEGHKHTKSDITDFSHNHTKDEITDFQHTHTWSDLTDETIEVDSLEIESIQVESIKVNGQDVATQDYVQESINQAITGILNTEF